MNKFFNKYAVILLITAVVLFYLGSNYLEQNTTRTNDVQEATEEQYALPANVTGKMGPHGGYDPHAALTPEEHIQVALQHKQAGRSKEAMRTLAMAILQHSENKDLYAVRGSIYLEQGKAAQALSDIEKALKIDPDDSDLLINRAQIYRQFGEIEQALADLNKAIESDPDRVAARFNRGAIYYSSEEFEQALRDFDHCIAIDPHAPAPYFNRASTRHALGDIDGAREDLNRFIQLSDNEQWNATARDLLQRLDEANKDPATGTPES